MSISATNVQTISGEAASGAASASAADKPRPTNPYPQPHPTNDDISALPGAASGGGNAIENMVQHLARLPGLGPRSARRVGLHLLRNSDTMLASLINLLNEVRAHASICEVCGNIDVTAPCGICTSQHRNGQLLCVVKEVGELWAIERSGAYRGRYHVLGGLLSGVDKVGPEDIAINSLLERVRQGDVSEVILGLNATLEGQTTSHYLARELAQCGVAVTRISHGVPIGGELDYLDGGTLGAAFSGRHPL